MSFISKTIRNRVIPGKFGTPRVLSTTPLTPLKNLDFSDFLASILNIGGNGKCCLSQKL